MRTSNCVYCGKEKAHIVTGYVLKDEKKVQASFCSQDHSFNAFRNKYDGNLGEWKEEYGLRR